MCSFLDGQLLAVTRVAALTGSAGCVRQVPWLLSPTRWLVAPGLADRACRSDGCFLQVWCVLAAGLAAGVRESDGCSLLVARALRPDPARRTSGQERGSRERTPHARTQRRAIAGRDGLPRLLGAREAWWLKRSPRSCDATCEVVPSACPAHSQKWRSSGREAARRGRRHARQTGPAPGSHAPPRRRTAGRRGDVGPRCPSQPRRRRILYTCPESVANPPS